ncbi:Mov34/MPN/PAD-1 family protein [Neobacillus mesonae]|uniref:Mov34/MPN/PAD-1 family protein n=1 Tax=Neobacillus mesonae TaxID=1193713 RepID=UPI00191BE5AE|nr:Mov34/MPN/PAD-1 family protein [Neobacillus mesonae]
MIKVIIPTIIKQRLENELKKAGNREIGGIIMGEHIKDNTFRIYDITVQTQGGSWARFVRQLSNSVKNAFHHFFQKTHYQYTKYNYLGEWHSHPSFALTPSQNDVQTMLELVNDKNVGANFAILLIVKFDIELKGDITLFVPDYPILKGELLREEEVAHERK